MYAVLIFATDSKCMMGYTTLPHFLSQNFNYIVSGTRQLNDSETLCAQVF